MAKIGEGEGPQPRVLLPAVQEVTGGPREPDTGGILVEEYHAPWCAEFSWSAKCACPMCDQLLEPRDCLLVCDHCRTIVASCFGG